MDYRSILRLDLGLMLEFFQVFDYVYYLVLIVIG